VAGGEIWAVSVCSAYQELARRHILEAGPIDPLDSSTSMWKALWKLQVMPKIHVFWWLEVNNILPCFGELKRRHMQELSFCPLCGHEEEDLYHTLNCFEHAKLFWYAERDYFGLNVPNLHPITSARDIVDNSFFPGRMQPLQFQLCGAIGEPGTIIVMEKYQPRISVGLADELKNSLEFPSKEKANSLIQTQ
jgi:hypothetical protein